MWRLQKPEYQYDRPPRPPVSAETRELQASLRLLAGLLAILALLTLAAFASISSNKASIRCERAGGVYSSDAGCVQPYTTTTR
jgi:hypothetical protein